MMTCVIGGEQDLIDDDDDDDNDDDHYLDEYTSINTALFLTPYLFRVFIHKLIRHAVVYFSLIMFSYSSSNSILFVLHIQNSGSVKHFSQQLAFLLIHSYYLLTGLYLN